MNVECEDSGLHTFSLTHFSFQNGDVQTQVGIAGLMTYQRTKIYNFWNRYPAVVLVD